MARRRRKKHLERSGRRTRTVVHVARPVLIDQRYIPSYRRSRLLPTEDRRLYTPVVRTPRTLRARPATVVSTLPMREREAQTQERKRRVLRAPERFAFRTPREVPICIRRERRKRALFANGFAGSRGRLRGRKIRRNELSKIGC